jgi:type I restriction enzyme S subunit
MQISQAWSKTVLGEVANLIGGSQPPKSDFISEEKDGYIRLLQIRDYKTDNYKTYIPIDKARRFCSKEDVMIGRYGPPVFQILRGLEGSYNVALMKAEPVDGVDKNYLYYLLKQDALFRLIDGLSQRTAGQSGVDMDALRSYPVLLPALTEQKRIAAILDKADSLRRKNQQAIQLADQFLRAVFLDMFGDPVTNPKRWNKTPLSELIKVSSGNGLIASQMEINGKFPVYGGNGINGHHSEYMFEEPQLVIGRVGVYCGVIHITEPKAWITDNALYVKEYKQEIDMHFLAESLKQANLNQYAGRAAQPLISGSRIYPLEFIIPPLDNQKEFSKLKKGFLALTEKFDNSKLSSEYLFNSLSQKAFAGEL